MNDRARVSRRALFGLGLGGALQERFADAGPAPRAAPPPAATLGEGDSRVLGGHLGPAAGTLASHGGAGRVLVVAAGDGAALGAFGPEAHIVATEADPALLERGRERVPNAQWHAARPSSLPFADGEFDAVLAWFGAAYARDPARLARELTRVARPGAPVALLTWSGATARAVNAAQPAGGPRPGAWSRYETAYRHFFGFDDLDVHEHELAVADPPQTTAVELPREADGSLRLTYAVVCGHLP